MTDTHFLLRTTDNDEIELDMSDDLEDIAECMDTLADDEDVRNIIYAVAINQLSKDVAAASAFIGLLRSKIKTNLN